MASQWGPASPAREHRGSFKCVNRTDPDRSRRQILGSVGRLDPSSQLLVEREAAATCRSVQNRSQVFECSRSERTWPDVPGTWSQLGAGAPALQVWTEPLPSGPSLATGCLSKCQSTEIIQFVF